MNVRSFALSDSCNSSRPTMGASVRTRPHVHGRLPLDGPRRRHHLLLPLTDPRTKLLVNDHSHRRPNRLRATNASAPLPPSPDHPTNDRVAAETRLQQRTVASGVGVRRQGSTAHNGLPAAAEAFFPCRTGTRSCWRPPSRRGRTAVSHWSMDDLAPHILNDAHFRKPAPQHPPAHPGGGLAEAAHVRS